ncbi:MAG TPA: hypothetical protein VIL18_12960 [Longimicrobiales bacterium]
MMKAQTALRQRQRTAFPDLLDTRTRVTPGLAAGPLRERGAVQ